MPAASAPSLVVGASQTRFWASKLYRIELVEGCEFSNEKLVHSGRADFRGRTPCPFDILFSADLRVADRVHGPWHRQRWSWAGPGRNYFRQRCAARAGARAG